MVIAFSILGRSSSANCEYKLFRGLQSLVYWTLGYGKPRKSGARKFLNSFFHDVARVPHSANMQPSGSSAALSPVRWRSWCCTGRTAFPPKEWGCLPGRFPSCSKSECCSLQSSCCRALRTRGLTSRFGSERTTAAIHNEKNNIDRA